MTLQKNVKQFVCSSLMELKWTDLQLFHNLFCSEWEKKNLWKLAVQICLWRDIVGPSVLSVRIRRISDLRS